MCDLIYNVLVWHMTHAAPSILRRLFTLEKWEPNIYSTTLTNLEHNALNNTAQLFFTTQKGRWQHYEKYWVLKACYSLKECVVTHLPNQLGSSPFGWTPLDGHLDLKCAFKQIQQIRIQFESSASTRNVHCNCSVDYTT